MICVCFMAQVENTILRTKKAHVKLSLGFRRLSGRISSRQKFCTIKNLCLFVIGGNSWEKADGRQTEA